MSSRALSRLRWLTLLLAAVVLALQVVAYFVPRQNGPVVHHGVADVGAPFSLTDHLGRAVTDQSLRGRPVVIYFGWTRDPDLTPAALQILSSALDHLGPTAGAIVPIFITIDPERDSMKDLKAFVVRFHPRLIGLIGKKDGTDALIRAFRLYAAQIPDASLPGGYRLDHASLYYVLGADFRFRGLVPHTTDVGVLAAELENLTK